MEHELQARKSQVQAIVHDQGRKGATEMNQERDTTDTTVNRGRDDGIGFLGLLSIVFSFGGAVAFWMSIHYGTTAKALPLVLIYGILGGVFWIGDQSGKEARNGDK